MTTAKSTSGVLTVFATRAFSPVTFERQPQSDAWEMRVPKFYLDAVGRRV